METEKLVSEGTLWFPKAASLMAEKIDTAFYFIYYGSIALFLIIVGAMLYFIIRYRRRAGNEKASSQIVHNTPLEIAWTVLPLILVLFIFWWGWVDYKDMVVSPANSLEYRVKARQWSWSFHYPREGIELPNRLVVPVNQSIKLIMDSADVIHSFYLPNFRVKKDILPNRFTTLWFQPNRTGKFQIFCTEYCGDRHSYMLADLEVLETEAYDSWLAEEKKKSLLALSPVGLGKKKYEQLCASCHTLDGTPLVGPTWKGLFGIRREFVSGPPQVVDENYLRESIINPAIKVVKGYQNQMAPFAGILSDKEIDGLIEFIKSVK